MAETTPVVMNKEKQTRMARIDPRCIIADSGFNVRKHYGDMKSLKSSIAKNGVKVALHGQRKGKQFILTDGFRRHAAVMELINEGKDIKLVKIEPEPKDYNIEQRLADSMVYNSDRKSLNDMEIAQGYLRLRNYSWSNEDIAAKFGKEPNDISTHIKLTTYSKYLQNCLERELVTHSVAKKIHENHPDEKDQKQVLEKCQNQSEKAGKTKIMASQVTSKNNKPKRTTKTQKEYVEMVKIMKEEPKKYIPLNQERIKLIMNGWDTHKTPQAFLTTIIKAFELKKVSKSFKP